MKQFFTPRLNNPKSIRLYVNLVFKVDVKLLFSNGIQSSLGVK